MGATPRKETRRKRGTCPSSRPIPGWSPPVHTGEGTLPSLQGAMSKTARWQSLHTERPGWPVHEVGCPGGSPRHSGLLLQEISLFWVKPLRSGGFHCSTAAPNLVHECTAGQHHGPISQGTVQPRPEPPPPCCPQPGAAWSLPDRRSGHRSLGSRMQVPHSLSPPGVRGDSLVTSPIR